MNGDLEEVLLTGGRITPNVTRMGNIVYRPCCPNSPFVHHVLQWLEAKQVGAVPQFLGLSKDGREMTSFLEGDSPPDLGYFHTRQLSQAGRLIKHLHEALSDFPGCKPGQTICHNDLSPCNFMFSDDIPYAVFDWDAAKIGDPLDDVAYALWMWCNIGYALEMNEPADVGRQIRNIIEAYGLDREKWPLLPKYIYRQMQRVAKSLKTANNCAGQQWAEECKRRLKTHENEVMTIVLK